MKKLHLLLLFIFTFSLAAFAQESAGPGASVFDSIVKFLTSAIGGSSTIALILEFVLRLFKSKKPLSILYAISFVVRKVADVSNMLAEFLDKVIPQRLE